MEVTEVLAKSITETSYLTTENTKRYRPILRLFFEEYERINYLLYKEDVYRELKGKFNFENYTMEMCENDLQVLVEWGNLNAFQDTNNVLTVEEFKHRKFRYQLTPFGVEIERLVITLENLHIEGSSLEPTLIERIREEVEQIRYVLGQSENKVLSVWDNLNSDFKRLNQNYQDYIKSFYNVRIEEVAKSQEFIIYKNDLVVYLRQFIKVLQENSYIIEKELKSIDEISEKLFLDKVYMAQSKIIHIDKISEKSDEKLIRNRNKSKWKNIKKWFVSDGLHVSEVEGINDKTTQIIRTITRIANQIAESRGNVNTRKAEYRKICEMFAHTKDIEEAHKLSGVVFGMFNTRHIRGDFIRQTDNINSSILDEEINMYTVKPRTREYREKIEKSAIVDKTQQKQLQIQKYLEEIEKNKKEIQKYIKEGRIDIKMLPVIKSSFRKQLLKWISKAELMKNKQITIEDGSKVTLLYPQNNERCILNCDDGKLDMPAYILEFENKEE